MSYPMRFFVHYSPIKRIGLHVFFWIVIFFMHFIAYDRIDIQNSWILLLKDAIALLSIFYITSSVIIPNWLMRGKFFKCIIWAFVIYVWWAELSYLAVLATEKYLMPNARLKIYLNMITEVGFLGPFRISIIPLYLLDFIFLVSLPLGLKVMQAFVSVRGRKVELELANMELQLHNVQLELAFLKSQINPHFLFNTLNNIQYLVSEHHPSGEKSLFRLSGIMYYLLHESNRPMVTLEEEYTFLQNFVELEKLGLDDDASVALRLSRDEDGYLVVPLIVFPFVENAFKHGLKPHKGSHLSIDVHVQDEQMRMVVSNGYHSMRKPPGYVGGVGLENVRKRLELNYGGRYSLDIKDDGQEYTVVLHVDLSSSEMLNKENSDGNSYLCL